MQWGACHIIKWWEPHKVDRLTKDNLLEDKNTLDVTTAKKPSVVATSYFE